MPALIFANTIFRLRTVVGRPWRVMGSGGKGVQTESSETRYEKYEVSVSGGKWNIYIARRGTS